MYGSLDVERDFLGGASITLFELGGGFTVSYLSSCVLVICKFLYLYYILIKNQGMYY